MLSMNKDRHGNKLKCQVSELIMETTINMTFYSSGASVYIISSVYSVLPWESESVVVVPGGGGWGAGAWYTAGTPSGS